MSVRPSSPTPSYEQVIGNSTESGGLRCIDIIPMCLKKRTWTKKPVFEDFNSVVEHANDWLSKNPRLRVKTCETVKHQTLKKSGKLVNMERSAYVLSGQGTNEFVIGLRLWLQEVADSFTVRSQQIGYFDMIPRVGPGVFEDNVIDRLDILVRMANQQLYAQPLPGKIVTIQTVMVKLGVDSNATYWTECSSTVPQFLCMLRVFYLLEPPAYEAFSVLDFVPEMVDYGVSHFEEFPAVLAKARQWLTAQPSQVSLLNVQTMLYKANAQDSTEIDTLKTSYNESILNNEFYKYLRLTYVTTHNPRSSSFPGNVREQVNLNCKYFVPNMLSEPGSRTGLTFETQLEVRERMDQWVMVTGARLVSIETLSMRVFCGREEKDGFDIMHTWDNLKSISIGDDTRTVKAQQMFLITYRVYVDGVYPDPPVVVQGQSIEQYMRIRRERVIEQSERANPKNKGCLIT